MKKLWFIVSICLFFTGSIVKASETIKDYDLKYYYPKNLGLKNLVYEVRLSGIDKLIKRNTAIENAKDVHFRVSWRAPDKVQIKVVGLPKGFLEVERRLKQLLVGKLHYVVPPKMSFILKGFKLAESKTKTGETKVTAEDSSGSSNTNKLILVFAKDGKLTKLTKFNTLGMQVSRMTMGTKSWSRNKWILEKDTTVWKQGRIKNTVITKLSWTTVSGIGFPSVIKTKTIIENTAPGGKRKKL